MKNFLSIAAHAALVTLAGICFAGCEPEDIQDTTDPVADLPVLSITTGDSMPVPAEGSNACEVAYTIENAVEGGNLSASAGDCGWLGDFAVADGKVTFTATANDTGDERSAEITLTYTYGNEGNTVTDGITVKQPALETDPEPEPVPLPVIFITTADNMPIDPDAAESKIFYIEYEVGNPVDGAEVSASSTADWLKSFTPDPSANGISFTASSNTTGSARTAVITVTYTYSGTESVFDVITVSQESVSMPESEISFIIEGNREFDFAGGSTSFYYDILDGIDGGELTYVLEPSNASDWLAVEITELPNTVNINVSANDGSEGRSATINLQYKYGDMILTGKSIEISQSGKPEQSSDYDYEFAAVSMSGTYSPGFGSFYPATFTTKFEDNSGTEYNIYFAAAADDASIPSGEYVYDYDAASAGTFGYDYTYIFMDGSEIYVDGGTVNVTNNGDGTYAIDAVLTDENGRTHHLTFSGPASF